MKYKSALKYSFKSSLPVMAGYIVLGIGFGLALQSKGYNWPWAALMSAFIYAGSMQYLAIGLLSGGASILTAALTTLAVNFRHIFYGISMLEKYKNTGAKKPYLIFSLTDETFSLVCSDFIPKEVDKASYYLFVSVLNQIYWVLGSTIGAVIGSAFTFNTAGVDFAMTALFIVIFIEQWETVKSKIPSLLGIIISLVCLLIFGPSRFLIPSMIGISFILFAARGRIASAMEEKSND